MNHMLHGQDQRTNATFSSPLRRRTALRQNPIMLTTARKVTEEEGTCSPSRDLRQVMPCVYHEAA
jgi:hypothetical protein